MHELQAASEYSYSHKWKREKAFLGGVYFGNMLVGVLDLIILLG